MTVRWSTVSPEKFLAGDSTGPGAGPAAVMVVRRDGAMTNHRTPAGTAGPLDLLDRHLARRSAGRAGADALGRLAAAGVPTAGCADPHDLTRSCRADGDPSRSETVTAALLPLASHDEIAGLCLLVLLGPALRRLAGRLVRMGVDREEAEQRVMAASWAAVTDGRDASADRLLGRTWSTLRTELRRELRRRAVESSVARHDREPADPRPALGDRAALVLDEAWRAGALTRRQVLLLHEIRVLDRSVDDVAGASGRSRAAVWKEGQRAARALRRFLADDPVDDLVVPGGVR
jgi:hypothetical protein